RPIERKVEGRDVPEAVVIRGYCAAGRSSLTDDGRRPLAASGLVLKGRLVAVVESLDRVEEKRGSRRSGGGCSRCCGGPIGDSSVVGAGGGGVRLGLPGREDPR